MNTYIKSALLASAFFMTLPAITLQAEQQVYGWQLMSKQERQEHRTKMQNMKTAKERERYRLEHHKKMEKRAKQQGVTLPDHPQPQGEGMGFGNKGKGGGRGR